MSMSCHMDMYACLGSLFLRLYPLLPTTYIYTANTPYSMHLDTEYIPTYIPTPSEAPWLFFICTVPAYCFILLFFGRLVLLLCTCFLRCILFYNVSLVDIMSLLLSSVDLASWPVHSIHSISILMDECGFFVPCLLPIRTPRTLLA